MTDAAGPWPVRFETAEDKGRHPTKTREFSATLVSFISAPMLWSAGGNDPLRPVFALLAMSRDVEIPFVANLKEGKKKLRIEGLGSGRDNGHPMEFLKSAGYEFRPQRVGGGVMLEVFLRDLFEETPGMVDEQGVTFLLSEDAERYEREAAAFDRAGLTLVLDQFTRRKNETWDQFGIRVGEAPINRARDFANVAVNRATVLAEGRRFAAAIHERADIPLLPDPLFGVQILCSAMAYGFAARSTDFSVHVSKPFCEAGMDRAKRHPGLAFTASHVQIEAWLAAEVATFDRLRAGARRALFSRSGS